MAHALTIDLEDWFHICGVERSLPPEEWGRQPSRLEETTREVLDILAAEGARATFFVLGWIADRYPHLVREVQDRGHRIGSHGHLHRRVYDLTPEEFAADLDRSVEAIGAAAGRAPTSYRAPEWSMLGHYAWAYEILASRGFTVDSSVVPLTWVGSRFFPHRPYAVETPAGPVTEVPLTTLRVLHERLPFTGGLSLRLFPEWYVARQLELAPARGDFPLVYMHPCDFEGELPDAEMPTSRRLIQRLRRGVGRGRIERLLGRFRFVPLEEALEEAPAAEVRDVPAETRAAWRRSFWISNAAYFILAPALAVTAGAVLGPAALLVPPGAAAAGYLHHASWRLRLSRRRRRLAADPGDPAPVRDVPRLDGVPAEPADLSSRT